MTTTTITGSVLLFIVTWCGGAYAQTPTATAPSTEKSRPKSEAATMLSLQFQMDLMLVSQADICSRASRDAGNITCVDAGTELPYNGDPLAGEGGHVDRNFPLGSLRLLFGFERMLGLRLGLGGRVGYATGGGPTDTSGSRFFPLYVDAHLHYWLVPPAQHGLLLPFVGVLAGVAQAEARVRVTVTEAAPGGSLNRRLDAWERAGFGFAGFAGGLMVPLHGGSGPIIQLKVLTFFPTTGFVVAPDLGYGVRF